MIKTRQMNYVMMMAFTVVHSKIFEPILCINLDYTDLTQTNDLKGNYYALL